MAWMQLIIAGLFEAGWAIGLKYTDGFSRLIPSLLTGAAMVISMFLLAKAARTLPIGTAYAVWVGIGTIGAVLLSAVLFDEPMNWVKVCFLSLLIFSIMGLKFTA